MGSPRIAPASMEMKKPNEDDEMVGVCDLASMTEVAVELKAMVEDLRRENKKLQQSAAADKDKTKDPLAKSAGQ